MPDYEGWPPRPVNGAAMFKSDLTPVKVERHNRRQAKQKALEDVYKRVDARDRNTCRVTGRSLTAGAVDSGSRREHHHLVQRSRSRARRADEHNIILVSALAHDLITRGWIAVEGTDARKALFFHWTALAKSKPIVIKRANPRSSHPLHAESQNRQKTHARVDGEC